VEDGFSGSAGSPPDATKFDWGGDVVQDGAGQLYLSTGEANTSWLRSKAGAAPDSRQTLVLQMRAAAYAEPAVYGDLQPRGLRVGGDADNAVEFYSIYGNSLGMRVRKDGVESVVSYALPSGVNSMHDYEISVTTTSVCFKVDGEVAGTFTTNIPTGILNVYVSTYDGGLGNVPVNLDSLSLKLNSNNNETDFFDGFEEATLDPFWVASLLNGTINSSTAWAHSGTQSAQFSAPQGGQKYLHLRHVFDAPQRGTVTVWVYDSMEYIYFSVSLFNSAAETNGVGIGVQDWDASAYYGPNGKSSVPRAVGWRKFTLKSLDNELVLSVDDQELYRSTGVDPFSVISLTVSGPGEGTIYFDDIAVESTGPDADGNGLPDEWELDYFGIAGVNPNAFCSNGVNTRLEAYIAGLNPNDPAAAFSADIHFENGEPVVTWLPDLGAVRKYTVEGRESLLNGDWAPVNAGSRFFRVRVERP
jgi:hypothetical protein